MINEKKPTYGIDGMIAGIFTRYQGTKALGKIDCSRYVVYVNTRGEDFPIVLVRKNVFIDGHIPNRSVFIRGTIEKIEKRFCLGNGHCKTHEHKEVYTLEDVSFVNYYVGRREFPFGGIVVEIGKKRIELVNGPEVARHFCLCSGDLYGYQLNSLRELVHENSFVDETTDKYKIVLGNGEVEFSRLLVIKIDDTNTTGISVNGKDKVGRLHIPASNVHFGLMNLINACE